MIEKHFFSNIIPMLCPLDLTQNDHSNGCEYYDIYTYT